MTIGFDGEDQPTLLKNQRIYYDTNGDILLAPLLDTLGQQGFDFENWVVTYFSDKDQNNVFVSKYPVPADSTIPIGDLTPSNPLQIKLRPF